MSNSRFIDTENVARLHGPWLEEVEVETGRVELAGWEQVLGDALNDFPIPDVSWLTSD